MVLGESLTSQPEHRTLRRAALVPAAVLSALALSGCLIGNSSNQRDRLRIPGMPSPVFGRGDEAFKLSIDPASSQGPGAHKLLVGVNMDCAKSGQESTSVTVDDAVNQFVTSTCDVPQLDTVDVAPGNPLYNARTITVHVNPSKPGLAWSLSVETAK
jgi:hypothetical protein